MSDDPSHIWRGRDWTNAVFAGLAGLVLACMGFLGYLVVQVVQWLFDHPDFALQSIKWLGASGIVAIAGIGLWHFGQWIWPRKVSSTEQANPKRCGGCALGSTKPGAHIAQCSFASEAGRDA